MAHNVPKVFISATSSDLRSVRQMVRDALLNMGCLPVVQEHFGPDFGEISGMLRRKIEECDAFIHIAGMRYGAEPDSKSVPEGQPRRSYTQMEVDLARELELEKVFTFVCPEGFPYDTSDVNGEALTEEREEFRTMQAAHRERLLVRKELRYESNTPEELAMQVREIQLELQTVKGELAGTRKKMLKVGAAIAVALAVVAGGVFMTIQGTDALRDEQKILTAQVELQQQAPRVLSAYQERFREVRDDPNREATLPNTLIDKMVRAELPGIVELTADAIEKILKIEAPRLAADRTTPINLKLAALFAMGEYDATLERGKELLVEPTIEGLRTMGDAALAKFEKEPGAELREEAIRYYRGSQALIDRSVEPEKWATTSMLLASVLHSVGTYQEAANLNREALQTRERILGREHPDTLNSINNLASSLEAQGNYEEAEPLHREALKTRSRVLGREHPTTLNSINNLASLLAAQGNYEEAEPLHWEALKISKRVLGREHPSTLISINNLAFLLAAQGNYEEAEPLHRETLKTSERVLGREHPGTLASISNLASLLESQGNYEEAEPLFQETLKTSERVFGREHPSTLASIGNLASMLEAQGNYEEAEPLHREALKTRSRVLGREHPGTLASISNLASLLAAQGKYDEAEPLNREAMKTRERVLGREHPSTLASISNLAVLLHRQGNYEEAEPLYREALKISKRVLGREHPDTLISIINLASLLKSQGKYEEAEPLNREALKTCERVLGREHPTTLNSINNLGFLLEARGNYEEAEPLYREALKTNERVLGREHPTTLNSIGNLASSLKAQGKYKEAEMLFREAYVGVQAKFGDNHPFTRGAKAWWEASRTKLEKSSQE